MHLSSLVTLLHDPSDILSPEDILDSALGSLFPDDTRNQHGTDANTAILYTPSNPAYKPLKFRVADVTTEEERTKFAHYLWNAGILMGELIAGRSKADERLEESQDNTNNEMTHQDNDGWNNGRWWVSEDEESAWNMKDQKVLELGAGVGLAGVMSVFAGAEKVILTDYPARSILDNISTNVASNLPKNLQSRISVQGHMWNNFDDTFSLQYNHSFTRIIAADCFWIPHEHTNLALSMVHFLSPSPDARILVIAGFHTGRAKMAGFFEKTLPEVGLEIEEIFELDTEGRSRSWAKERHGADEDVTGRKKWLAVARLRRMSSSSFDIP